MSNRHDPKVGRRLPHEGAKVTAQSQSNKRVQLYALYRTDVPEMPTAIEHGGPAYMSKYDDATDPAIQINWYGVLEEDARMVPLRLEVEEVGEEEKTYTWKFIDIVLMDSGPHHSPGDIFVRYVYRPGEQDDKAVELTFEQLVHLSLPELRDMCRYSNVLYYNKQTRTQLALMLNAPVPQEEYCPSCDVTITMPHTGQCQIAICLDSGNLRRDCNDKHGGRSLFHGAARWNGYAPGVLESYVYSVTPEAILAKGRWDKNEKFFVYQEDDDVELDETTVEPEPDDEVLRGAVNEMLNSLGQLAKERAAREHTVQEASEVTGIPVAGRDEEKEDE